MKPKTPESKKKKLVIPAALAVAVLAPLLATHLTACSDETGPEPTTDAGVEDVVEEPIV